MEGPVDPQIKQHLECLNSASERINVLENILTEKRNQYRSTLTESTHHLNTVAKRIADNITKARPYFEARKKSEEALQEAQKAAIRFERAVSMHNAAREMVTVAEQALVKGGHDTNNTAWPEMLNHANLKVNEAEKERIDSEVEHQQKAEVFKKVESNVKNLEKKLKVHIAKSRGYFEKKDQIHKKLQNLTISVTEVDASLSKEKQAYSEALLNLENISESIHAQRRSFQDPAVHMREPGVGAETVAPNTSERQPTQGRSKSTSSDLNEAAFPKKQSAVTLPQEEPTTSITDEQVAPYVKIDNHQNRISLPRSPKHGSPSKSKMPSPAVEKKSEVLLTIAGLAQVSVSNT